MYKRTAEKLRHVKREIIDTVADHLKARGRRLTLSTPLEKLGADETDLSELRMKLHERLDAFLRPGRDLPHFSGVQTITIGDILNKVRPVLRRLPPLRRSFGFGQRRTA